MDEQNEIKEALRRIEERLDEQGKRMVKLEDARESASAMSVSQDAQLLEEVDSPSLIYPKAISVPPPPPPKYVPEEVAALRKNISWEVIFGGNWLARIGAVAIIIGLGFFLAMAISNGWIGPIGQIVLGVLVGAVMLVAGELFREKYGKYAQALTGGGIGSLYVSFYAAFAFHQLIGEGFVFILMALVTAIAAALAIHSDSISIAVLGIIGGYVTPFLLSSDLGGPIPVLAYVAVLNLGILVISRRKAWNDLIFTGLVGSAVLFFVSYFQYGDSVGQYGDGIGRTPYLVFLSIYFVTFLAATLLANFLERKRIGRGGVLVLTGNAFHFYAWVYFLLSGDFEVFMGIFTLVFATLYLLLAIASFPRKDEDVALSRTLTLTSVAFLIIAVPVQFSEQWITIAWAAEAMILVWMGLNLKDYWLRAAGAIVMAIAVGRLLLFDLPNRIPAGTPDQYFIFNTFFATFFAVSVLMGISAWLYRLYSEHARQDERYIAAIYGLGAVTLMLIELSVAVLDIYESGNEEKLGLSVLWLVYAAVVLFVGVLIKSRATRLWSIVLIWIAILKVFLYDTFALGGGFRVTSYLVLGGILFVAGLIYQRYKDEILAFFNEGEDAKVQHGDFQALGSSGNDSYDPLIQGDKHE